MTSALRVTCQPHSVSRWESPLRVAPTFGPAVWFLPLAPALPRILPEPGCFLNTASDGTALNDAIASIFGILVAQQIMRGLRHLRGSVRRQKIKGYGFHDGMQAKFAQRVLNMIAHGGVADTQSQCDPVQ